MLRHGDTTRRKALNIKHLRCTSGAVKAWESVFCAAQERLQKGQRGGRGEGGGRGGRAGAAGIYLQIKKSNLR